jgi:hypothetical protein
MPGPREEERRKAQVTAESDEALTRQIDKAESSKRKTDPGKQQTNAGTRARRTRGRSGSDSNASSGTRGH